MKNIFYYETSIGKVGIAQEDGKITNLILGTDLFEEACELIETELLKSAKDQLVEYLEGKRKDFDLPLAPKGTPFMQSVWQGLCNIPYGETKTYKEIAGAIGNEKACRAVGSANNKNPIPIFIPCHRVIGANGKLIGYRGGLEMKTKLLDLEKTRYTRNL